MKCYFYGALGNNSFKRVALTSLWLELTWIQGIIIKQLAMALRNVHSPPKTNCNPADCPCALPTFGPQTYGASLRNSLWLLFTLLSLQTNKKTRNPGDLNPPIPLEDLA